MENNTKSLLEISKKQELIKQELINEYIEQLEPLQKKSYYIAISHLKTSFDIERSNGFNEWVVKHTR